MPPPQDKPLTFQYVAPLTFERVGDVKPSALTKATGIEASKPGFWGEMWQRLNPKNVVDAVNQGFWHPVETTKAIGQAQGQLYEDAKAAAARGDYLTATRKAINWLLPLIGPDIDDASDHFAKGEYSAGTGASLGIGLGLFGPQGAANLADSVRIPGIAGPQNAARAEAVAAADRAGVPVDAATASGNRFVGAAQHVADRSLGGSFVAGRAAEAQAQGLGQWGRDLAARTHPAAVTQEQAGLAVSDAVRGQMRGHGAEASRNYNRLREIEADPANTQMVLPDLPEGSSAAAMGSLPLPTRFAKQGASTEELFQAVLGDARNNGFTGSADTLKVEFMERLRSARSLRDTMADAGEQADLFQIVREQGGLDPRYMAELGMRTEEIADLTQWLEKAGLRGKNSVIRTGEGANRQARVVMDRARARLTEAQRRFDAGAIDADELARVKAEVSRLATTRVNSRAGQSLDDLATYVKEHHPELGIETDWDLLNALRDRAIDRVEGRGASAASGADDWEHLLRATGVEKGAQWWSDKATGAKSMQAPVDMRQAKADLRPVLAEWMAALPPAQQQASRGLHAIRAIVEGPDFLPLSAADKTLGAVKAIARVDGNTPRGIEQGLAAKAVSTLQDYISMTAEGLGSEALGALEAGRAATRAKYSAAEVLKRLSRGTNGDGVRMFNRLTANEDSAIALLRDVHKNAPEELPKIGRAYLDDLVTRATSDGGFKNAASLANEWQRLGPETKRLLFRDPSHLKELDDFWRFARLSAENANPSGTAHTVLLWTQGGLVVTEPLSGAAVQLTLAGLSKMMHSRTGVRLLTQGFKIPVGNKTAAVGTFGQIARMAGSAGLAPAQ